MITGPEIVNQKVLFNNAATHPSTNTGTCYVTNFIILTIVWKWLARYQSGGFRPQWDP